jgi:hypothetical protein
MRNKVNFFNYFLVITTYIEIKNKFYINIKKYKKKIRLNHMIG